MNKPAIVLDANILIRAVLGQRVRELIGDHSLAIDFFAPEAAYAEARNHLPRVLRKRGIPEQLAISALTLLEAIAKPVQESFYLDRREEALARISKRDPNDWPVLACALILACPIWTEDADFFGVGVPTWTTDRVHIYFETASIQSL